MSNNEIKRVIEGIHNDARRQVFENAAVPFVDLGGRLALRDEDIIDEPVFADFMRRFAHCFERDDVLQCYFLKREQLNG